MITHTIRGQNVLHIDELGILSMVGTEKRLEKDINLRT
jgi:hypothetical protein